MSKTIFLDAPKIGVLEKSYLSQAIDDGYISSTGPFVEKFEDIFAEYIKVKKAVSIQSGTAAIYMALHELGIGKGDEVIVPALTFVATINPILQIGAVPVIVDVDRKTWNIDPDAVEKNITRSTKAVIPVHLYGNPCDMLRINNIAHRYKIFVIEDATESLGATYKGRQTGSLGDLGCFSFNGNKIITTGGGGMITGNNVMKVEHIKFLINQAKTVKNNAVYHPEVGFNYRMTNIEAALGLAQMKRLKEFLSKKLLFHDIYARELERHGIVSFQQEYTGSKSSWWFTSMLINDKDFIPELMKILKIKGVPSRRVFVPLLDHLPYKNMCKGKCENARFIFEHGLCLPGSTRNTKENIKHICKILKQELVNHGKN